MTKTPKIFAGPNGDPSPGDRFTYKGQEFACVGWSGAVSTHGYRLHVWRSRCAVCGAPFEQTATRAKEYPTRTCLIHRRGLSVRAPVFG